MPGYRGMIHCRSPYSKYKNSISFDKIINIFRRWQFLPLAKDQGVFLLIHYELSDHIDKAVQVYKRAHEL